ncbi:response regulator transcription factor [Paenibacillus hodogayensis]|uniref:Response regulator transcription factor n=1 Tax=Paenibacillus hodogayensis TaxID=279208 RepID=A0ABV5W0G5_9BACL
MSATVMTVDDDSELQEILNLFLTAEGFRVLPAYNARQCLDLLQRETPDLILLDLQMPDMDGATLCRQIRTMYDRPILFLSGNKQQEHKLQSLQSGGDDYMTKPFDPLELVARMKANLRWSAQLAAMAEKSRKLRYPGLEIDLDQLIVKVNGEPVALLPKELQLLLTLAQHPNRVFHPGQLYEQIWDSPSNYSPDTIKTHMHNLRKKLEGGSSRAKYIATVKGFGYKFAPVT